MDNFLPNVLDTAIKSIVSIVALFFIAKLLGKKHIAQLTFFDYIVGIVIGSIAASFSVENNVDYETGLTAILTWGLFSFFIAYISMKSMKGRRFLDGTPTIFIQNGAIIEENLKKEKVTLNDMLEELRGKGIFNVADVEFAILESDGNVSLQLKPQKQPLTPSDLDIPAKYQSLPANIIIDGNVMAENLKLVNHDRKWLEDELSKKNIHSSKDILLATLDNEGKLQIFLKGKKSKETKTVFE